MNSLSASLNFWLKSQCQTYDNLTQSILVLAADATQPKVLASFPEANELSSTFSEAVAQVTEKQRLYLAHLNDQQVILGHPVFLHNHYWGAVIIQLEAGGKTAVQNAIKSLQKGLVWLQFLLHEYQKTEPRQPKTNSDTVTPLLKNLLKETTLQETAIYLVNALASNLHASRISLGWQTGKGVQLAAISASASFDPRTDAMQLLAHTMLETVDQGMDIAVVNEAPSTTNTTVVLHYHQHLLQQQNLQSVQSFLLRQDQNVLGVIVIEKSVKPPLSISEQHFVQSLLAIATQIFDLKQRAEASLWQSLKQRSLLRLGRWFGNHERGKKVIVAIAVTVVLILFLPMQYQVTSDASLQSIYKHLLVAPQDGYLKTITARPGDIVKKGDVLAQLNDDETRLEERKVRSQRQQYEQEYDNALAISNRVEAAIANAKVEQASIQLRLLEQQLQRAQLLAPADGIVVSDDISQTLGAPIKQGDVLFEIAASAGYIVQLFVDEREIAAIKPGQSGQIKLTSLPSETFEFSVKNITPISEVRDGRNYFRVEANLVRETEQLRTGMTGSGKIAVGRRALGWIWLHDIWHWLRLSLWW